MGTNIQLKASDEGDILTPSASLITVPRRWLKFMRRCLGLQPGRYILVLTIEEQECDWSLQAVGRVER